MRMCCNEECDWVGETDRYLGSVGPLCPQCGEVTEPTEAIPPEQVLAEMRRFIDGDEDTIFRGTP